MIQFRIVEIARAFGDWQKNSRQINRWPRMISGSSQRSPLLYGVFFVCFDGHLNERSRLEANLLPLGLH
jgi:hypothetical protein